LAELSLGFSAFLFLFFSFRVPHRGFTVALQALASHHIVASTWSRSAFLFWEIARSRGGNEAMMDGDPLRPHRFKVGPRL